MSASTTPEYATLNRRMFAALIDTLLLLFVIMPLNKFSEFFFFGGKRFIEILDQVAKSTADASGAIALDVLVSQLWAAGHIQGYILSNVLSFIVIGICICGFWMKYAATPGKLIMKCKIVDANSLQPISFNQAVVRYVCYLFSALVLCLGFIMIQFSKKSRGLHDILAGTIVIVNRR